MDHKQRHIAILGSVGVPACYGGFETLAEQLARYHASEGRPERLSITCSAPAFSHHPDRFAGADLDYLPLSANGVSSVPYDAISLGRAKAAGADVALLLGVSGACALPFLARGSMRVIVHVDGREWHRSKWSPPARMFLKYSEALAMRHADAVIADSPAIARDLWDRHRRHADVLTYGGDQAAKAPNGVLPADLPQRFALSICRIEPENNVEMLLTACMAADQPLVCVGNWAASRYGRALRARFSSHPKLRLLDPIYAPSPVMALRRNATVYLHGHSAGGTNPSLVEIMHVGCPVLAYDCVFNRQTTHDAARYFTSSESLAQLLREGVPATEGAKLKALAQAHYRWDTIGEQYFDLFRRVADEPRWAQKSKISSRKEPRRFFFLPRS